MKTSYRRPHSNVIPYPQTHRRAYPNAAEHNRLLNKALDYALADERTPCKNPHPQGRNSASHADESL